MSWLDDIWSGGQDWWNNLFGNQDSIVSPLQNNQSQGFIGPLPPGSPGGAGFIGPVQPGQPDIRFPQAQPQPQGTFQQPSGNQSDSAQPPPYAPNVVNQTVSYGGATWKGNPGTGWTMESSGGGGSSLMDMAQALIPTLVQELEVYNNKLSEYQKNNPFVFDEAQARASSESLLNPYYDATLNEFMTGIRRSSQRSVEDMTRTIGELNVDASKLSDKERFNTQEAIRSSEEGYAGAGLFFSGKRERASGLEEVGGMQAQEEIQTKLGRGVSALERADTRTQQDLKLRTDRETRLIGAERTTALETDIAKRKREQSLQSGLEAIQFAGRVPGKSAADQMLLENQFTSGIAGVY